jgi:hypothetical protein
MSLCNILSDERMGLSFTIAAGPRQLNHSVVRVPRDSWTYFIVSDSRLPQPKGPSPRIYIPQKQGVPVIPPGTGFHFRRLLLFAGLRWMDSNPPPPHGVVPLDCLVSLQPFDMCRVENTVSVNSSIAETCLPQKTSLPTVPLLLRVDSLLWEPVC